MTSPVTSSWKGVELTAGTAATVDNHDDGTTDSLMDEDKMAETSEQAKTEASTYDNGDNAASPKLPPRRRKQFAISTRWEREQEERARRGVTFTGTPEDLNTLFCCFCRRIGGMFVLVEKKDGTPVVVAGPCWPFCLFVTVPMILGISGLVAYYIVLDPELGLPWWLALLYFSALVVTFVSLFFVSCRDPGLIERVTDEEAGHGGWFWNEQVGSFRPAGAMYCRECKALIQDYDHLCPW
eukprot:CAMPEP_0172497876 /NCGR_PEP_ID=MMETSP1066-20121228/106482_1 /TAXON_ID=671091 /ORGANISM="Coscinodiscus wailesii, Strain CCMP2513" /LENGTH=238 /DNA_ID=CAMNT_0013270895 /DNA_START=142 /DNA_END=855 /DNA_ORIENTATION=+